MLVSIVNYTDYTFYHKLVRDENEYYKNLPAAAINYKTILKVAAYFFKQEFIN